MVKGVPKEQKVYFMIPSDSVNSYFVTVKLIIWCDKVKLRDF